MRPRPGPRLLQHPALAALLPILIGLAACSLRPSIGATPPVPTAPPATLPTITPTPATPRLVLVAPQGAETGLAQQVETALQSLAASASLEFVRQPTLPDGDAPIALLVALPPDPGVQAWSLAHPEVQSAGFGIPGLQAAPNLSRVAPEGLRHDQLGFALGYLAALITPEYRIGALALDASPSSLSLVRGFVAGGTYYCGLCRPLHPPYLGYPALLDSAPADPAASGIRVLLLAPAVTAPADAGISTSSGLSLMGVGEPGAQMESLWLASADFDVAGALENLWQQTQTGTGGVALPLGIRMHSVDVARVSPGRLALTERLIADLVAGRIDTGVDPATGQAR